jgi:hypothetical protein
LQEDRDIGSILRDLQSDPEGFAHLGDDGVIRTYTANFTVLSFAKLNPEQIWAVFRRHPQDYQERFGPHWTEVYENVDGRTVSNVSQILHPGDDILPDYMKTTSPNEDALKERDLDSNFDLAKRQGCVGRVCIRSQWCVDRGCRLCMVSDRFIEPQKLCVD